MINCLLIYGKYLLITSYIRKPFLIYFATDPIWISIYIRGFLFYFFVSDIVYFVSPSWNGSAIWQACLFCNGFFLPCHLSPVADDLQLHYSKRPLVIVRITVLKRTRILQQPEHLTVLQASTLFITFTFILQTKKWVFFSLANPLWVAPSVFNLYV